MEGYTTMTTYLSFIIAKSETIQQKYIHIEKKLQECAEKSNMRVPCLRAVLQNKMLFDNFVKVSLLFAYYQCSTDLGMFVNLFLIL